MIERKLKRRSRLMYLLIPVAVLYVTILLTVPTVTGNLVLDGVIGVLLGLYVCSYPAANLVDTLYYEREIFGYLRAEKAGVRWLVLNLTAMLMGWVVITIGFMRWVGRL